MRYTARKILTLLVTMLVSLSVFPLEFVRKLLWRVFHGKGGY